MDTKDTGESWPTFSVGTKVKVLSTKTRGRFPVAEAAFLMGAESKNARVHEISAHGKDPQVVKISPEPSTTARVIICAMLER